MAARTIKDLNTYELKSNVSSVPDVVASDSSRVLKSYSLAVVYALQAVAVRASPMGAASPPFAVKADAGYYIPSMSTHEAVSDELLRRVVQFVSRDLEISAALELLDGADIALLDGSLFSFLWYGKLPEVPAELRFITNRPRRLRELWRGIVSSIVRVKSRSLPVFVAKSIRRSYYTRRLLPDNALSEVGGSVNDLLVLSLMRMSGRLPRGPFALEPIYLSSVEELPSPLNALDREDRERVEPLIPVTVTYVSFGESLQPYQVSIPGRLSAEELVELFSSIRIHSPSGYPDPLKVAHSMCKLSSEELKYLLLKLEFSSIPTGRELLGELL